MSLNIFSSLAKYNTATNENYLTESLIFVTRLLLDRCPLNALELVNLLCGQSDNAFFSDAKSVNISTQITTDAGTPDIGISDSNSQVYIEVKHDSPLGVDQLERYKDELDKSDAVNTNLVLLTRSRYSYIETTLKPDDYSRIYWYEIYNWLSRSDIQDNVCKYFLESFMDFLDEKRMSLRKVSQDYKLGIPALLNLTNMLRVAIVEVMPGVKITNTGGWNWRGFYLPGEYWFGVRYSDPLVVTFEDNRGYEPVTYRRSLDLLNENFFSLNKDEQFECLAKFLREASDSLESFDNAGAC